MTWNKKAIMTKFLVSLVLALVLFVPACYAVSKLFFRLSDQAVENFEIMGQKLQEFAKGAEDKKSFTLIMDKDSFVALYPKKERQFIFTATKMVGVGGKAPESQTNQYYWDYPPECQDKTPCLCLCRVFETPDARESGNLAVNCQETSCYPLEGNFESWSFFRRGDNRRVIVNFIKENETVKIQ